MKTRNGFVHGDGWRGSVRNESAHFLSPPWVTPEKFVFLLCNETS